MGFFYDWYPENQSQNIKDMYQSIPDFSEITIMGLSSLNSLYCC